MADKIYCGSAKARDTQYGEELTVSVNVSTILENLIEYGFTSEKSNNKYITLKINRRKEVGRFGETHSLTIDTWKPNTIDKTPEASRKSHDARIAAATDTRKQTLDGVPNFPDDIPF